MLAEILSLIETADVVINTPACNERTFTTTKAVTRRRMRTDETGGGSINLRK